MSCEVEEESSMDEDDDMPGLESVSSSEYVSDEDSVILSSDGEDNPTPSKPVDPKSPSYTTAQAWLNQNRADVLKQIQVITIHLLSPFLYGCSHQTDKWLRWCFNVGLLQSDVNYNTGALNDVELCAVYVLDKALEWCKVSVTKEGVSPANLAELLQLAEQVQHVSKLPRAIRRARKKSIFITMLQSVEEMSGKSRSDTDRDPLFIEAACLYVITQIAEHVENVINEKIHIVKEHEEYCLTSDKKCDNFISKGDELKEQGRLKECIAQYTTTINLCPYNPKLYTSRAHCYISTKDHRTAMADGLRAVYLKPDCPKCHLRYIQGLDGCGMTMQAALARKRFAQLFPGQSEDIPINEPAVRQEPTADDRSLFEEITRMCKRGSESFQGNDMTNATYWYEEVWQKIKKNSGWKRCLEAGECDKFLVSLHYVYGSALIGRDETVSTEIALPHFETIMTEFTSVKFPAAYYGAGKSYTFLRQHSDAVGMAKLGLEMLTMSSNCQSLLYPGTTTMIEDSIPELVEVKLHHLIQQCKISSIPDAVCRYANCTAPSSSNRIWSNHQDYRGHMTLECNHDCNISYHPYCWRKFKTESEQKTDKEFLLTPCPTPDCCGFVRMVIVYDNKGAIKAKFEASAESVAALTKKPFNKNTKALPPSSSSTSTTTTVVGKRTRRRKYTDKDNDKQSPVTEDNKTLGKEIKKPEGDKSEGARVDKGKEKSEGAKVDKGKEKSEGAKVDKGKEKSEGAKVDKGKEKSEGGKVDKGKEKSEGGKEGKGKSEGVKEGKGKEKGEGVKVDKEKGEGVKVDKESGEGVKVDKESGEDVQEEALEDVRRAEDSLAVIDRQRETESQEANKQKYKKKKVKKAVGGVVGVPGGEGEKHWNELFTLPERQGMMGEDAATTDTWHPDPQAPFQTPSHLREAVQEFERSQVPGMGLHPNSVPPASDSVPLQDQQSSEDLEFIYSFFAEIFKTHGPLKPSDATLSESLSLLPEGKKQLISDAGGIETFLLQSSTFCSHEGLICLSEDSALVADSITHRSSSASSEPPPLPLDERLAQDKSSSSSTASGTSPRDTPTDSPHTQKKTVDKPVKTGKKNKTKASKTGSGTNNNSSSSSSGKTPVALAGSSKVGKVENGATLLQASEAVFETTDRSGPVHRAVQTERVLVSEHWVMTDPIPVTENFKERYEMVLREKIDLRAKLEESEDHRFKLQRDHKREMEKLNKTVRHEAKEEAQVKIRELEGRVQEEKDRVQQEKRDQAEQLKSHKAEIKSLIDKVDRLKKEISKRDQHLDSVHLNHQTDMERVSNERRKLEERLRLAQDNTHLAMQRAIAAEVDLLQMRVDGVMKPGEARLLELDRICGHFPPNSDLLREWLAYQEKLRTALECFQMATEEQIQAVKSGRELSSMEKIPNPSVPLPAHLAFRGLPMMRPPFPPGPMRMPMRGSPIPMGARPMEQPVGFPAPGGHPGGHPGVVPPHPIPHPQQQRMEAPVTVAAALPQSQTGQEPPATTTTLTTSHPPPSHPSQQPPPLPPAATGASAIGASAIEAEHRGKSSFDRIVEKLVPHYPGYSREDFKMILREVRRKNHNTLSGLSLDSIAEQVRSIIEAKERSKGGGGGGAGEGAKVKPRAPLPPVALAPPPVNSSMEYTEEWSCVICYEDMDSNDSSRLVCGHRFHTECIKSWFKEQNTCPTCRNYALLPDEYPFLGHKTL